LSSRTSQRLFGLETNLYYKNWGKD